MFLSMAALCTGNFIAVPFIVIGIYGGAYAAREAILLLLENFFGDAVKSFLNKCMFAILALIVFRHGSIYVMNTTLVNQQNAPVNREHYQNELEAARQKREEARR